MRESQTITDAKLRLPDKLDEIRNSAPGVAEITMDTRATFADAVAIYTREVNEDTRLVPATKEFRLRPAATVRRVWPKVYSMELRNITPDALKTFMREFEGGKSKYRPTNAKRASIAGNSPTVINALVGFFRRVFEIGMRGGIVTKNPALGLKRMRPRKKLLELPNKEEFAKMIEHIRTHSGRGRIVGDLVEGLLAGVKEGGTCFHKFLRCLGPRQGPWGDDTPIMERERLTAARGFPAPIERVVGQKYGIPAIGTELAGVLEDICAKAKTRIGKERGETLYFESLIGTQTRSLKLHCDPGDTPIPVLTLMFSNED